MPSKKKLTALLVVVVLVAFTASAAFLLNPTSKPSSFSFNAGIIDQLAGDLPDPTFVNDATSILENHGFNVTYYNETLDVDFFRRLPEYNLGVIVLRAHSALRLDSPTVDLFTSEPYSSSAHTQDQQNELLVDGFLNYSGVEKHYFAITSKFIQNMQGTFPRSIVIAMGCNSLKYEQLADAFINKGATAYIGWDGYVGYTDTDQRTTELLTNLLVHNDPLWDAVRRLPIDLTWLSRMEYYPSTARDLRILDLAENVSTTAERQPSVQTLPFEAMVNWVGDRIKGTRSDSAQTRSPGA